LSATDAALESVLKRDRVVVLASLGTIVGLAWGYLLWLSGSAAMMSPAAAPDAMPGMDMPAPSAPSETVFGVSLAPRMAGEFLLTFVMWSVMMIGMMLPSAAPMILLYARVGRQARESGRPFGASAWFACGYLIAWCGFALAATGGQWALQSAALLTPMMASASPALAAALLIAAGIYQWTPLKDACLAQCQSPFQFIQAHGGFRSNPRGALTIGLRHGLYCIGCCWSLMLLLFVGGVMNLLWIAALAAMVLIEKLLPVGNVFARVAGCALIVAGVLVAGT
jgi:predicted metal-binding membrane protein